MNKLYLRILIYSVGENMEYRWLVRGLNKEYIFVTDSLSITQIHNRMYLYNGELTGEGTYLFYNEDDAKEALEWVESINTMSEISQ